MLLYQSAVVMIGEIVGALSVLACTSVIIAVGDTDLYPTLPLEGTKRRIFLEFTSMFFLFELLQKVTMYGIIMRYVSETIENKTT